MLTLSVLIPTYRRTEDLARCLAALKRQTCSIDEVLLVIRDTDTDTWEFLKGLDVHPLPIRTITVTVPGQVAALNAGLDAAKSDIIAITDDDAAPHIDWLERIEAHFRADEHVGGVGGRDWVYMKGKLFEGSSNRVGHLQWFGRVIGNHCFGKGSPREVDMLKGANMSYRRSAIAGLRFDEDLRGTGAQVHNDLAFSLSVKRKGWKLIYDPAAAVDHFPAERFDEDGRHQFSHIAIVNSAHNETLTLLKHLSPGRRLAYLLWSILIGTCGRRGIVQLLRFLPKEGNLSLQKWLAAQKGCWLGWQTWNRGIYSNQD